MKMSNHLAKLRKTATRLAETGENPAELRRVNRQIHAAQRHLDRVNRRRARVAYLADTVLGGRTLATLRTAIVIDQGYAPDSWK